MLTLTVFFAIIPTIPKKGVITFFGTKINVSKTEQLHVIMKKCTLCTIITIIIILTAPIKGVIQIN